MTFTRVPTIQIENTLVSSYNVASSGGSETGGGGAVTKPSDTRKVTVQDFHSLQRNNSSSPKLLL